MTSQVDDQDRVLIAGGGIAGLALALTPRPLGVKCRVYEAVNELQPQGVGINLEPVPPSLFVIARSNAAQALKVRLIFEHLAD